MPSMGGDDHRMTLILRGEKDRFKNAARRSRTLRLPPLRQVAFQRRSVFRIRDRRFDLVADIQTRQIGYLPHRGLGAWRRCTKKYRRRARSNGRPVSIDFIKPTIGEQRDRVGILQRFSADGGSKYSRQPVVSSAFNENQGLRASASTAASRFARVGFATHISIESSESIRTSGSLASPVDCL